MRDPADEDMAGMISTEYLERCLQKCSLNNVLVQGGGGGGGGGDFSYSSSSSSSSAESHAGNDIIEDQSSSVGEETTLDLNSHISLPLHWERCLDLKSGEIYYINWRTGKKVWEEDHAKSNLYYSPSSYESCSEESISSAGVSSLSPSSSSTSSCLSSSEYQGYGNEGEYRTKNKSKKKKKKKMVMMMKKEKKMENQEEEEEEQEEDDEGQQVLVVAGCRNCFMYFMVPRLVQNCPKCLSQLLHFDHEPSPSSS